MASQNNVQKLWLNTKAIYRNIKEDFRESMPSIRQDLNLIPPHTLLLLHIKKHGKENEHHTHHKEYQGKDAGNKDCIIQEKFVI